MQMICSCPKITQFDISVICRPPSPVSSNLFKTKVGLKQIHSASVFMCKHELDQSVGADESLTGYTFVWK